MSEAIIAHPAENAARLAASPLLMASNASIDAFCDALWLEHGLSRNTPTSLLPGNHQDSLTNGDLTKPSVHGDDCSMVPVISSKNHCSPILTSLSLYLPAST